MQWKQIKTLFILCFLVLNIYLLVLLINKQDESEYALPDTAESSFEQQLESENISISADLPEGDFDVPYVSLSQKSFTDDELAFFEDLDNQQAEVVNQHLILSRFEEPVAIPEDADNRLINELVESRVLSPEHYTFGGWNKDMNVLIFFQQQNELPIYYNYSGILLVYLNDDNEMLFYTETMLDDDVSPSEEQSLIEPIKAIQALFDSNRLQSGDEITDVNMGFHTRIPLESGEQVFSPTWTITVNDEANFYVNAIENLIISSDELTFLTGAVTNTIEKIQEHDDDSELKAYMSAHLKDKLSMIQESE
ncbi:two-component system regulatory protein YycI [Lentibacillus salinarum]|uniref:Two-component system regulatory protein YycI n=1 Tax=Lentibacillus salinarum TaxID=446820 RepID=A0ABW3ZWS1_9BACI